MFKSMSQNDLEQQFIVSAVKGGREFYESLGKEFTSSVFTLDDFRNIYLQMEEMISETGFVDIPRLTDHLEPPLRELFESMASSCPTVSCLSKEDFLLASSELSRRAQVPFPPMSWKEVEEILGRTIKQDDANKSITFMAFISVYTEESQLNVSYNAPSSTGKSYIPIEIAKLFPPEDVIEIAYCSPQAFFHDHGSHNKETHTTTIDFSRKVIVFLDQPNAELLARLRPMLSHDKKEILSKITDKSESGGNKTKNIKLIGFPAVIFCTASLIPNEQESTRFILLSPEMSQEKLRAAIEEKVKKESNRQQYEAKLKSDPRRTMLKKRIVAIRDEKITYINISNSQRLLSMFSERHQHLIARNQRDVARVIALAKASALLNLWHRERDGAVIVVNDEDIDTAFYVWDKIARSQEQNLPPYVYQVFEKIILPLWNSKNGSLTFEGQPANEPIGITRKEILLKYYEVFQQSLDEWRLRQQIILALESAGLIYQQPPPTNGKILLIFVVC